jgi:hypothetical protein
MPTELANAKTTATLQQRHDLLDAWLAALRLLDNPLRRRREQRPRRLIPIPRIVK